MYVDVVELNRFRTFRNAKIDFVHPDRDFKKLGIARPQLPNINLLLGNNGFGKTTLLRAIALSCLGPAVDKAGIYPYRFVRREPGEPTRKTAAKRKSRTTPLDSSNNAIVEASFTPHEQDGIATLISSRVAVQRRGDLEQLTWDHPDEKGWHPIFSEESDAFFFVGYGATRRVEQRERFDPSARKSRMFIRAQRVQSLFEDSYSLVPLNAWLPQFERTNKGRYTQVVKLMNLLSGGGHYKFTGEIEAGEYLFERGGLRVPFPALSDGYRAFLGWIGDLLYHVCMTCPSGKKLVDNRGIVMVDEIDLHLHPQWQMTVLPTLAKALPNIQFIVTSHSPLVVGSLEWSNIIVMKPAPRQATILRRIPRSVHGLDADQVLLTDFFGLQSTRAPGRKRALKDLALKAREGDPEAARQLLEQMSRGAEATL